MWSTLGRLWWQDPTEGWPVAVQPLPMFDPLGGVLGRLRIGDPVESARFLGRPSVAKPNGHDSLVLAWPDSGLELSFHNGRLDYIALIVAPDETAPDFVHPCQACLSSGQRWTKETSEEEIMALWGEPQQRDTDAEERVLWYWGKGVEVEVELTPQGKLKRVSAYEFEERDAADERREAM